MAKDKQKKQKERERRVAQKKLAAKKRAQEQAAQESKKAAPERPKVLSAAIPKIDRQANHKSDFTHRRSGG